MSDNAQAFEYVAGTLRGAERDLFEQALVDNPDLQAQIQFWEEQLFALTKDLQPLPPAANTWRKIAARLDANTKPVTESRWQGLWRWALPGVLSIALAVTLIVQIPTPNKAPNADYVAVLTDDGGKARLTALSVAESRVMWLQWNELQLREGHSAQLWSVSRVDGQIQSVAVLDSLDIGQLALDETAWGLVKNADSLLLTEEAPGGSTFNEPSDVLLAKGVCVRFWGAKAG